MKVFIERSIQWRYTYDDIGVHAPTSVSEVGNRTTAEGKTYTANNLNQYTAIDDFAPQYDADGNQTLIKTETGIWSVVYNAENRPIRWQSGDTVITMAFDRMGRRVWMREREGDTVTKEERFVYDGYLCVQRLDATQGNAGRTTFLAKILSKRHKREDDGREGAISGRLARKVTGVSPSGFAHTGVFAGKWRPADFPGWY